MYGLNPHVYGEDNSNSPYYVNPCDTCRAKGCYGCPYADDTDDNEE